MLQKLSEKIGGKSYQARKTKFKSKLTVTSNEKKKIHATKTIRRSKSHARTKPGDYLDADKLIVNKSRGYVE